MKRKKNEQTSSTLFKPETVGHSVEGLYSGHTLGKWNHPILQLETKKGNVGIPVSFVVQDTLKNVIDSLKEGKDRLKFVFIGHPEKAKGNAKKTILYQIFLNGKELARSGGFSKMDKKAVASFYRS